MSGAERYPCCGHCRCRPGDPPKTGHRKACIITGCRGRVSIGGWVDSLPPNIRATAPFKPVKTTVLHEDGSEETVGP